MIFHFFSSILLKNNIIKEDDIEVYDYAMFVIIFNLLTLVTLICIGILFNQLSFTIMFLLFYLPNRIFIGGYHCKTPLTCYLTFTSIYLVILISNSIMKVDALYIPTVIVCFFYLLFSFKYNIVKKNLNTI